MNDKLKDLLYDLQRTKDIYKARQLITEYALKEPLGDLDDILDIQCSSGNWDYNEYMQGMVNGMIFARACITGEDPEFLSAPKEGFLADRQNNASIGDGTCNQGSPPDVNDKEDIEYFQKKVMAELGVPKEFMGCTCGPGDACSSCPEDCDKVGIYLPFWERFGEKGSAMVIKTAQSLFDNRLGWRDFPYAPRSFWADLGEALYGEDDGRVKKLRNEVFDECTCGPGDACSDCPDEKIENRSHVVWGGSKVEQLCDCNISEGENACSSCKEDTIKSSVPDFKNLEQESEKTYDAFDMLFSDSYMAKARKTLRNAFEKDEAFKLGYMANIRMFINDRTDVLIDEQVIYDMIDYIFQE